MKAKSTFVLAAFLLTALFTLPALATPAGPACPVFTAAEAAHPVPDDGTSPTPAIDEFTKECNARCAVMYCAKGTCGVHTDKNGQRACGCYDPYSFESYQTFVP